MAEPLELPNTFSVEYKEVISYSREEALRIGNNFISTEHLILGMFRHANNPAVELLKNFHVDLLELRIEIESKLKKDLEPLDNTNRLPLTKEAEKVIRMSVLEAKVLKIKYTDSANLLLAILKIQNSIVTKMLNEFGVSYKEFKNHYQEKYLVNQESVNKQKNENLEPESTNKLNPFDNNQIDIFIERIINVNIKDSIDGVLNIGQESAEIASLLTNLSLDQGMMFGLFGQWGRGKTFFWKNIWDNLSSRTDNPFIKVEFHAWKYQDTPATWAYLYETLSEQFYNKPTNKSIYKWALYYLRILTLNYKRKGILPIMKFLIVVSVGVLLFFSTRYFGNNNSEGINQISKFIGLPISIIVTLYSLIITFNKEYSTAAKDIFLKYSQKSSLKAHMGIQSEIQNEIIKLFQKWIPASKVGKRRILLFIDDIDRCNEAKIIQIVDSLRIMLDETEIAKRCVIVAAIDERILKIAISLKYFDLITKDFDVTDLKKMALNNLVKEYMDKLFIGGIKLKSLNQSERREVLTSLTKGKINFKFETKSNISETTRTNLAQDDGESYIINHNDTNQQQLKNKINSSDDGFELEYFEFKYLEDLIDVSANITPRIIRIFYYRYLLAKRFLFNKLNKINNLPSIWHNETNKAVLPYLIMYFSIQSSPSEIDNFCNEKVNYIGDFNSSNCIAEFEILENKFSVKESIFREIIQIVEIIVPY